MQEPPRTQDAVDSLARVESALIFLSNPANLQQPEAEVIASMISEKALEDLREHLDASPTE